MFYGKDLIESEILWILQEMKLIVWNYWLIQLISEQEYREVIFCTGKYGGYRPKKCFF